MAFHVICFYDYIEYVSDSIGVLASVREPRECLGNYREALGTPRELSGIIGSLGNDLGTPRECLGNYREPRE